METEELLRAARETVARVTYCTVVTVDEAGDAVARLVQPLAFGEDWCVAFITGAATRKAADVRRTGRMTLGFQHDAEGAYVALVGRARLDLEPEAKARIWIDDLDEWFPNGPGDPGVAAVRFETARIEVWSYARRIMPAPALLTRTAAGWRSEAPAPQGA